MSTATRARKGLRKMLVSAMAAMMLSSAFAPAAFADDDGHARGGDGGDGGLIGIGIGACLIIADCDDAGSGNAAGGDGGDATVEDD